MHLLLLLYHVLLATSSKTSSSSFDDKASVADVTTIAVCTGVDCRIDGSSDVLRAFHKRHQTDSTKQSTIRITGKPCLGPCGDGPCVMVIDAQQQRVQDFPAQVPRLPGGSWVPPDLFGTNPRGIYQVRTAAQLEEVWWIAQQTAWRRNHEQEVTEPIRTPADPTRRIAQSTRVPWDRPRNERKVVQRCSQALVGLGLWQYSNEHGGDMGNLPYAVAALLFLGSDVILKEGLFTELRRRWNKRRRR